MILPRNAGFDLGRLDVVRLMPRRTLSRALGRGRGSLFGVFLLGVMVCLIAAVTGVELFWLAMASAAQSYPAIRPAPRR